MVDIYGRSLTGKKSVTGITRKQATDLVSNMLSGLLTLKDADGDEIVVFDKDKKLVTSNISAKNISTLITPIDDFFGVPRQEVTIIEEGDKDKKAKKIQLIHVKATYDNLIILRKEYDAHVAAFNKMRENFNKTDNVVDSFFSKKIINELKNACVSIK